MRKKSKSALHFPTVSEARLLRVLWRLGTATVEQVVNAFPEADRPNYKTTHSFLRIMESKGFVEHSVSGKAFVFRPLVTQEAVASASVNNMLAQTFGGSVTGLMMNLLDGNKVSPTELGELERMIQEYRRTRGEDAPGETA